MRTSATTTRPTTPAAGGLGGEPAAGRATLLGRLGGWCFDHRGRAVGLWLVALLAILGAAGAAGSRFSATSPVPDSGSASGFAVLQEHFPGWARAGSRGPSCSRPAKGPTTPR